MNSEKMCVKWQNIFGLKLALWQLVLEIQFVELPLIWELLTHLMVVNKISKICTFCAARTVANIFRYSCEPGGCGLNFFMLRLKVGLY